MSVTWLLVDDDDEELERLELTGPGGTVRVSVGEPGRRSGIWRIWANKPTSDIYIAETSLAGTMKISLHQSGDWRHQWVTQELAEQWTQAPNRLIDQWPRPEEWGGGWTRALVIWIACDALGDSPGDGAHKKVEFLPAHQPERVYAIHVVVARPNRGFVTLKGVLPMTGFVLASGEVALVLVSTTELTADQREWRERQRAAMRAVPRPAGSTPRAMLYGHSDDGVRTIWDIGDIGESSPGS